SSGPPNPGTGGRGGRAQGGAAFNLASNHVVNLTFAENKAVGGDGGWGGLYNLIGCPAMGGDGGDSLGGGILNAGALSVRSSTIWNNTAVGGLATNHAGAVCEVIP